MPVLTTTLPDESLMGSSVQTLRSNSTFRNYTYPYTIMDNQPANQKNLLKQDGIDQQLLGYMVIYPLWNQLPMME